MTDRPILFSAPMVRAILSGSKSQTRRVLKQATGPSLSVGMDDDEPGVAALSWLWGDGPGHDVHETIKRVNCPYGQPGDRLWVRETFVQGYPLVDGNPDQFDDDGNLKPLQTWYRASVSPHFCWSDDDGGTVDAVPWKPSIHMPRWASRITLEVTGVRVERLGDLSESDARQEGVASRDEFIELWKSINGQWESETWTWVLQFRKV